MRRYHIELEPDGIYVTTGFFWNAEWIEDTRWLIPGTQED